MVKNERSFTVAREASGGRVALVTIRGDIGPRFENGVSIGPIDAYLRDAGDLDEIRIILNTNGGEVAEGLALYNLFHGHPARVVVHIEAIALSAGTVIAMAGDEIHAPENALLMVHSPRIWGVSGQAEDLRVKASQLDAYESSIIGIYSARTGKPSEEIRRAVRAETWFTAAEAKSYGLLTHVSPNKVAASAASYSLGILPANVPQKFRDFFKGEDMTENTPTASSSPAPSTPVAAPTTAPVTATATPAPTTPAPTTPAPVAVPVATAPTTPAPATPAPVAPNTEPAPGAPVRAHAALVLSACETYGGSLKDAALHIEAGTPISEVQQYFINAKAAQSAPVGTPASPVGGSTPVAIAAKAEFAANRKVFEEMGLTEEEYITSRELDSVLS